MELIAIERSGEPEEPVELDAFTRGACFACARNYARTGFAPPWIGYLAVEDGAVVGSCTFRAPPEDGRVEIGYHTSPAHEGKGVASRMAKVLVALAREADPSLLLFARTKEQRNASTKVLSRAGFVAVGARPDDEDGIAWEWWLPPGERPATLGSREAILDFYASGGRWFTGIEFGDAVHDLDGVDLSGAIFTGTALYASFRGTRLRGTRFDHANVKTCDFRDADLEGSTFEGSAIDGASFEGANLRGARFAGATSQGHVFQRGESPLAYDRVEDEDPREESEWLERTRTRVLAYLDDQPVGFGALGAGPAWFVTPYVSVWAVESLVAPGRVGWWVIAGDLPTDHAGSRGSATPREAVRGFAERWMQAAGRMERGEQHPQFAVGSPARARELAPLLRSRAALLLRWSEDDACWR